MNRHYKNKLDKKRTADVVFLQNELEKRGLEISQIA